MYITRVRTNPGIICFSTYTTNMCEKWVCSKQFLCAVVTGERCDVYIDECASNPCKNSATCVDYVNEFRCFCQPGWTGKTCDVDINECSSNPCKNDGQCVNELNGYSCKCKLAFSGTNCAINIEDGSKPNKDVCITQADGSSPCLNGGICVDRVGKYDCTCRPGWTGNKI